MSPPCRASGTGRVAALRAFIVPWALAFALALAPAANARELKIVFSQYTPPYVFEDGTGIVVDIVRDALARSGYSIRPVYVPIGRGFKMFAERQVDGTTIIQETSGLQAFYSRDFMQYHNHAFALRSRELPIRRLADLHDYRVIAFQNARKYLGEEFDQAVAANPRYKEMAQQKAQARMLLLGRADVIVIDEGIFRYYLRELATEQKTPLPDYVAFELFAPTPYKAAFNEPAVRDAFDRGIEALRKDGGLDTIYRRYAQRYGPVNK